MSSSTPGNGAPPRRIRSFVRRGGRTTPAQARALADLAPRYVVPDAPEEIDLVRAFGRDATRVCEIGFGNGDVLLALARAHPERDFLGIEVHEPGVGRLLLGAHDAALDNVRVLMQDAVEVFEGRLRDESFDEILVFFPDPWPKKRHHKRRLIQPAFVEQLARKLRPGGILRLATDWEPYAQHMLEVLTGCERLRNSAPGGGFGERPELRPRTRFEERGQRLGHGVWDLEFRRL